MFIKKINLHNFRRFSELTLNFSPGVNVLSGVNAVGKTTVIEAVYLFARGKSFRSSSDGDLMQFTVPSGTHDSFADSDKIKDGTSSSDASIDGTLNDGTLNNGKSINVTSIEGTSGTAAAHESTDERTWVSMSGVRDANTAVSESVYSMMLERTSASIVSQSDTGAFKVSKTFYKDRVKSPSTASFIGEFRAVLFCPDHLTLIRGASDGRRAFMDQAISQTDKRYVSSLQRAAAALRNRSALIKSAHDGQMQQTALMQALKPWSDICAREFGFISGTRMKYLTAIQSDFKRFCLEMSGEDVDASLYFKSDGLCENVGNCQCETDGIENVLCDNYSRLLYENIPREIAAGRTLFYPGHDDAEVMQLQTGQNVPVQARRFASQGQQRSLAIALKLAEGEYSKRVCGEYPVYLFDDVLSELDETRRSYILSGLSGRQVIITTCTPDLTEGFGANSIFLQQNCL